jgi:Alpha-N-acetylglucosaminidase (NAGLU) tim-barrel domain/Alpha-N-acetylglucosaminidase (NAGLU) C-terminal domain/Alpha-N-acetylglucosaminidase (NAGLU) N-terminal domain
MADSFTHYRASRREFLGYSGALLASAIESPPIHALDAGRPNSQQLAAAHALLERALPQHASQIRLEHVAPSSNEFCRITGSVGNLRIAGSTISALLMGVHWYLKYVAGVCLSWNGDSLNHLPEMLPAPSAPIQIRANGHHRFALNDTNDGYTGPFWTWADWERLIDVLALHGINEVLLYTGSEAVYQRTLRAFGYTDDEILAWLPTPAHQPWWLLQNLSSWVGPSVSQHLIDSRLALAGKIAARLRELGMQPVLPGYYGIVPAGFATRNLAARVIPQGDWLGMKRPDWLDPTCELFTKVAAEYYRVQAELLGATQMFKMDPLHEGGQSGGIDLGRAAGRIESALQSAHPGATWAILGWQENPRQELLDGIRDKSHVLILDGQSDRFDYKDREHQWGGTPYAFGTIWNFGGHTTMGANAGVWNERFFKQLRNEGSKLNGIALMPEASCNNPAAFEFFTELPWRSEPANMDEWFVRWSTYRYGGRDPQAARAWTIVGSTAYSMKSGKWSEAHDNLFSARPNLEAKSACSWSPQEPRYDLQAFATALGPLLSIDVSLRQSSAFRYDLVDVARQTIANHSRVLLPRTNAAYQSADLPLFEQLTHEWLAQIDLLNQLVATEPSLLLGRWTAASRSAAADVAEGAQLEFDACSLLLEWGPKSSRDSGVHDYANREWNGLLLHYRDRWAAYFSMLRDTLTERRPVREIDWFAADEDWATKSKRWPVVSPDNFYVVVKDISERRLNEAP